MTVISVSITESEEQVVAGIPKTVSISTNVVSTIFYTLDNTNPNLFSNIYTGPIFLPIAALSVTLKVLATNGVDYSVMAAETYQTNILKNIRLPHSATTAQPESKLAGSYPFGTNSIEPTVAYLSPGDAGITVYNQDLPATPTGFDGDGNGTGFTNDPYNTENYSIVYPTTNAVGESKLGVGNLPAKVTVLQEPTIPEFTSQFTSTFDPRAFVIFQDFENENPEDPPNINRQHFSLEDPNKTRDGNYYFSAGLDMPPTSGTFLRSHYNPRDNTMNYYYIDTWTNKWIISKSPYKPNGTFDGNLSGVSLSKGKGAGFVFEWMNFARRVLF